MVTDHAPIASKNPLPWWLTILIRSGHRLAAKSGLSQPWSLFMNILSMDLDLYGRLEAIQHHAKVVVLAEALDLWMPYSDDWALEMNRDLDMSHVGWLDEDTEQRPSDDDDPDPRNRDSPAWRSGLENLNHRAMAFLSPRKDIDTVLGEVGKLLSTDSHRHSIAGRNFCE